MDLIGQKLNHFSYEKHTTTVNMRVRQSLDNSHHPLTSLSPAAVILQIDTNGTGDVFFGKKQEHNAGPFESEEATVGRRGGLMTLN